MLTVVLALKLFSCDLTRAPATCQEVRACVMILGRKRAERLARRAGASDADIERAKDECLTSRKS